MCCATLRKGLRHAVTLARQAGLAKSQIVLDPGIGFGKSFEQNCELLARLPELARLGYPLLVGTSRKSFIAKALEQERIARRHWKRTESGARQRRLRRAFCKARTLFGCTMWRKWRR